MVTGAGQRSTVASYPLHHLGSYELFEDLVCDICRIWLGEGVTKFAPGKDGGRDCKFTGRANSFPSEALPLEGCTIVQAKWTREESASCSDSEFKRLLTASESPKAARLVGSGELDHWLIFTNRRKGGDTDAELEKELLSLTKAKTVHLRGREDICGFLENRPHLVQRYRLELFETPLRISPEGLRQVVMVIHAKWCAATQDSSFNFANYAGIAKKNELNRLSAEYFQVIKERSEPHFASIREFLGNPRNNQIAENYHAVADDFQNKIIARRQNYGSFDLVINALFDELVSGAKDFDDPHKRRLVWVVLHYMYCSCDIGLKP